MMLAQVQVLLMWRQRAGRGEREIDVLLQSREHALSNLNIPPSHNNIGRSMVAKHGYMDRLTTQVQYVLLCVITATLI
jgi:hypothetical protein